MQSDEQKNVWKVLKVVPENHDVNSLYIDGSNGKFSERRAGQFLSIRIPLDSGWSEPHPFTISCAPEDPYLRLTIKKIGAFTSSIPELKPGTEVKLAGPLGGFCKDIESNSNIVMIAGGVGITPFLSVLLHFHHANLHNDVKLFWSNKTRDDMFAVGDLNEMSKDLSLTVIHVLSREDSVAGYYDENFPDVVFESGRLTRDILKKYGIRDTDSVYICGPPPMQEFELTELSSLGIDPSRVERENFIWEKK
ncbi:MAG: FAD/NAD-binding family oxidoreductase [Desulfomonilia bacterium]